MALSGVPTTMLVGCCQAIVEMLLTMTVNEPVLVFPAWSDAVQ
jgi:hypothetical protein